MSDNVYSTDAVGHAAVRVSNSVTGPSDSIYGVDENGNAAVRVIGAVGQTEVGGSTEIDTSGLETITGDNLASILQAVDDNTRDLQNSVSLLKTTAELSPTLEDETVVLLLELEAMSTIDGRPSYKAPGAIVQGSNGVQGVISAVDQAQGTATIVTTMVAVVNTSTSDIEAFELGGNIIFIAGTEDFGILGPKIAASHDVILPEDIAARLKDGYSITGGIESSDQFCDVLFDFKNPTFSGFTACVKNIDPDESSTGVKLHWHIVGKLNK